MLREGEGYGIRDNMVKESLDKRLRDLRDGKLKTLCKLCKK